MKPARFRYARPVSVEEAVRMIAEAGAYAQPLAGGQSLVPLLNFRLAHPALLVDLNFLDRLTHITEDDGWLLLGSMVRLRAAETSPIVASACPLLAAALSHVGHLQIRNRGTVGGSVAHADPAAELPALMVGLGGQIVVQSVRGRRVIEAADFFLDPFLTSLASDELVVELRLPKFPGDRTSFMEFSQRSGDFALAGVGVSISYDRGYVTGARMGALGVGPTPVRLRQAEQVLAGSPLSDEVIENAAAVASREVEPLEDIHGDSTYRRELLAVLLSRSLKEVRA